MKTSSSIEPLESRIAPATLTGKILTYTDIDGDHVSITFTKTALAGAVFTFDKGSVDGDNSMKQQLQLIDLHAVSDADGADITMKVTKAGNGDGLANVGRIAAVGNGIFNDHSLGKVNIAGDLGSIDADAVSSLTVQSMGVYDLVTSPAGADLTSTISGALGSLTVKGDIKNAFIDVLGGVNGVPNGIGAATIGGSLIGNTPNPMQTLRFGAIEADGDIGNVKIGGDIAGVSNESGFVQSDQGKIKSITLGGSLIGGVGNFSGEIRSSSDLGPVKIGGNVQGGGGADSGFIASNTGAGGPDNGNITSVSIGGSLIGGAGLTSGEILSAGHLGPVKIGGDLRGGDGERSGRIFSANMLAAVTIGGSLIGGSGDEFHNVGVAIEVGQIHGEHGIGTVKIGRDVIGSSGGFSGAIANGTAGDKISSVVPKQPSVSSLSP